MQFYIVTPSIEYYKEEQTSGILAPIFRLFEGVESSGSTYIIELTPAILREHLDKTPAYFRLHFNTLEAAEAHISEEFNSDISKLRPIYYCSIPVGDPSDQLPPNAVFLNAGEFKIDMVSLYKGKTIFNTVDMQPSISDDYRFC